MKVATYEGPERRHGPADRRGAANRAFSLLRRYPGTLGFLLAILLVLLATSGINAAVTAANTSRIDALHKTQLDEQAAAAAQQRSSAEFIRTFIDAQVAECMAVLDTDRRLGGGGVNPSICSITLPAPTPGR